VTARTKNIYLFWGCGIEKRGFLAYFGACQAKIPVRGWCKLNISGAGLMRECEIKIFFGGCGLNPSLYGRLPFPSFVGGCSFGFMC